MLVVEPLQSGHPWDKKNVLVSFQDFPMESSTVQPFHSPLSEAVDPLVHSTASSDSGAHTTAPSSGGVREAIFKRQLAQLLQVHSGAGVSYRLVHLKRVRGSVFFWSRSEEMAPQSSGTLTRPAWQDVSVTQWTLWHSGDRL